MESTPINEAVAWLEKANADLEPELLSATSARELLAAYARAEKLASFGKTVLARKLDDAADLARVSGTSVGKAKATVDTAKALGDADGLRHAFRCGDISLDQATEIAKAEHASPGSATELLPVAATEAFHVLKERARKIALEAEQGRALGDRQHDARFARSHSDGLGMVHVHLAWEPHVGTPIVNRAEAAAPGCTARQQRGSQRTVRATPRRRLCRLARRHHHGPIPAPGTRRGRQPRGCSARLDRREEGRGLQDPGVGPVLPAVARSIAADAFLTGVFYDGKDLRNIRRWTRNTPVEVLLALELGDPPEFDGVRCVDCGNRFRTEKDHVQPHNAWGPASIDNLEPRCWSCHKAKTQRDRKTGKLARRTAAPRGP